MIDATFVKVHPHAAGAKRSNQAYKRGLYGSGAAGKPVRFIVASSGIATRYVKNIQSMIAAMYCLVH